MRYFEIEAVQLGELLRRSFGRLQRWVLEHRVSYVILAGEVDLRGTRDPAVDPRTSADRITPPRGSRRAVVHDGAVTLGNNNTVTVTLPVPVGRRRSFVSGRVTNGDNVARSVATSVQLATTAPGAASVTWQDFVLFSSASLGSGTVRMYPNSGTGNEASTGGLARWPFMRGGDGARFRVQVVWSAGGASAGGASRLGVMWEDEPDDGDNSSDDRITFTDPGV